MIPDSHAIYVIQAIRLAATAEAVQKNDPALALLLARAAARTTYEQDGSFTNEATLALYNALAAYPSTPLTGHTGEVQSVQFSPDGTKVVSTSLDDAVRIWDVNSGQTLWVLESPGRLGTVSFSPDGNYVLATSWDGGVRVWDVTSGEELYTLSGHSIQTKFATFSPDGTLILTVGCDEDDEEYYCTEGTARLWDVVTGEEQKELSGHTDIVVSASFNFDGTRLVTASFDGTARVWDPNTGEQLQVLNAPVGDVRYAEFSPDGTQIITANADSTVRLWNVRTGGRFYRLLDIYGMFR
jgi:WD40 repeat protein